MNTSVFRRKSVILLLGIIATILSVWLVVVADSRPQSHLNITDYISEFYVAGHMVRQGLASQIHPRPGTTSLLGTPFELYSHQLIEPLPQGFVALFLYPVLTALPFALLSNLPPLPSLISWQVVSVISLAIAVAIFTAYSGKLRLFGLTFFSSFCLFAVLQNLIMGQTDIAYALLPLTLGYVFWQKDRPILAGCIWALLWLKPTLLAIAVLVGLGRNFKVLAGLLIGTLLFHGTGVAFFGPQSLINWIHIVWLCLQTFNHSQFANWTPVHLVTSVPSGMVMSLPPEDWDRYRIVARSVCGVFLMLTCYTQWRIASHSLPEDRKRDILFLVPFFLLPLASVYYRLNDMVVFLLPAWIVFYKNIDFAKSPLIILCLAIDIYTALQLVPLKSEKVELVAFLATVAVASCMFAVRAIRYR